MCRLFLLKSVFRLTYQDSFPLTWRSQEESVLEQVCLNNTIRLEIDEIFALIAAHAQSKIAKQTRIPAGRAKHGSLLRLSDNRLV